MDKKSFVLTIDDYGNNLYEDVIKYYNGNKKPDYLKDFQLETKKCDNNYKISDYINKPINDGSDIKYRMYSIVLGQLSQIQKGIQSCHSVIEYSNMYSNNNDFRVWSQIDKTLIVLDAKDSDDIKNVISTLLKLGVKCSTFSEESLNSIITSVSFLVNDRIYSLINEDMEFTRKISEKEYEILEIIKKHHLSR